MFGKIFICNSIFSRDGKILKILPSQTEKKHCFRHLGATVWLHAVFVFFTKSEQIFKIFSLFENVLTQTENIVMKLEGILKESQ